MQQQITLRQNRIAASLFFFIQGLVFSSWASRIPDIKRALNLNDVQLGGVLFSIPVGQLSAIAFSAWAVNRWGSRGSLGWSSVAYPLFLVPLGLAGDAWWLSVALFLFGFSTNIYNIAVNTQGVEVERLYGRNILASFHGLWSMGAFVGGVVSMALVAVGMSPVEHFTVVFVASVVTAQIAKNYLTDERANRSAAPADGGGEEKKRHKSLLEKMKGLNTYLLLLGIVTFGSMICEGCMYDWSGVYFDQVVGVPDNLIRLGYIVCMCTMTMGRFVADRLVTRFGAPVLIRVSGLLIFTGLWLAVLSPTLVAATVGCLIVGFGISSTVPVCYSMAGKADHISSGNAITIVSSIGYLGFVLGPPLIGFMAHTITLHYTFGAIGCIGALIAVMSFKLKKQ